jgi:hypothetical protein
MLGPMMEDGDARQPEVMVMEGEDAWQLILITPE